MTQETYDVTTVGSNDTSVVWTPLGTMDNGTWLCTPHVIAEYNKHFEIALGLVPPAETMSDVKFEGPDGRLINFDSHAADTDHVCVACADGEEVPSYDPEAVNGDDGDVEAFGDV